MDGRNVSKNRKVDGCSLINDGRINTNSRKNCKRVLPSDSSSNSSSELIITTVVWTIIVILLQFIQDLLILIVNYLWNTENTGKTSSQVQHPQETVNIQTAADAKIKEIRKDGILKNERDNNLRLKILPNSSRIVDAFTDIGFCLHKNNIAMHEDLSAADSDIGSRPVSLENTNETSSECTDEPGISYTSIRYHAKNWCTRSGCDGGAASGSHVSRGLIQASSRSLMYRSPRHDLSITRHIVRVRSAHKKRAKSAAAVIRVGRPETELECYQNKSAFYYNHDQFY